MEILSDSLEISTGSDLNDPNSTPLGQGLVAWYPFDGNTSDMSGNGNDLSGVGHSFGDERDVTNGQSCILNEAHLTNTNASFSIDDDSPFSYSLWVKMHSIPSAYPQTLE